MDCGGLCTCDTEGAAAMALDLSQLQDFSSSYTESKVTSPELCTAAENRPCRIFESLHVWNEFLCHLRLELREQSPWELWLVALDYLGREGRSEPQRHQAANLVYWLLRNHRCVVGLQLNGWIELSEYEDLLIGALCSSSKLKSLKLRSWCFEYLLRLPEIARAIGNSTALEELECGVMELWPDIIGPLCSLVATSSSLSSLSLLDCRFNALDAKLLTNALSKSSTVNALSINSSCLMPETGDYNMGFTHYLGNSNTLTTLVIVRSAFGRLRELKAVVAALENNRTLSKVCLESFVVDCAAAKAIEKYLVNNSVIRSFSLKYCHWYEGGLVRHRSLSPCSERYDTDDFGVLSGRVHPWLSILRNNRSLEELRLQLSGFSPAECAAFLKELSASPNLKKVTIEDLYLYFSCRGRRTCNDASGKETVASASDRPDVVLLGCKQLRKIRVRFHDACDRLWFAMALEALHLCQHVTSLEIDFNLSSIDERVACVAAEYIEKTKVLKSFTLTFEGSVDAPGNGSSECRMWLLSGLSRNGSVTKFTLKTMVLDELQSILLAKTVRSSTKICNLRLFATSRSIDAFVNHLSPEFSENSTLVSIDFDVGIVALTPQYFAVKEVVRRNFSLVTRAAHFVMGNSSRRCINALELVADSPALIDKVCELASVPEEEAIGKVRDGLRNLRGLDDFMRATGVVSRRVSCERLSQGERRLDDLDDDSWFHVRSFLKTYHVLPSNCTPNLRRGEAVGLSV